jgi:aspartate kinase
MSGTTNSLVEITNLLYQGNIKDATEKIEALRTRYHKVADELFESDQYKQTGHELIDSHFNYMSDITSRSFTKVQEKAIVGEGELISTALVHKSFA